jgi:predicted dehydrogenase
MGFSSRTFTPRSSATEMLNSVDLDAVVVAVPHALHHPLAKVALERGVNVLLEKPMTIEPAHARELVAIATATGSELLIGYPWQYNPHARMLREQLRDGSIGELEHVCCLYASTVRELYRGDPEPYRELFDYPVSSPGTRTYSDPQLAGGGQGHTQVTHAAALLLWMTGLRVASVAAFTSAFELPVDLVDGLAIRFHGGAIGSLGSTGSVTPGLEEIMRCEVFGREGHVVFDVNQGTAAIHRADRSDRLPVLPADERCPVYAPAENLIGVTLGEQENGSPAEVGLAAVEVVSAMYKAASERRVVDIEEL